MDDIKKSYYAILPANVRYDTDLTPNAKLLYAEITSLCNDKGYCWAKNEYFAELYNVSDRAIQKWLVQLSQKNYITINMVLNGDTKEIDHREICIKGGEQMFATGGEQMFARGGEQMFHKNNKKDINNKIMNRKEIYKEKFETFWKMYPKKVDKQGSFKAFVCIDDLDNIYEKIIQHIATEKETEQWKQEKGKFIPNPTTYIHQRRWETTIDVPQADSSFDTKEFFDAAVQRSYKR